MSSSPPASSRPPESDTPFSSVYLDHNATTPLDPRVVEAMMPWLGAGWGNPSSVHAFGRRVRAAVEQARGEVAELLGAAAQEIVFTASGTEANNAVVRTLATAAEYSGHVVLSAFEHPSVDAAVRRLEAVGMTATRVRPEPDGVVRAEEMIAALRDDTVMVCLMLAQNEIGTLQPVAQVAAAARHRGVPMLCDAVQAPGKIPIDVQNLGVDYLSLGAHKLYGPLGAAALWVREGQPLESLAAGAGQEGGRRAGTENVAAIVGFGAAARWAQVELEARGEHSRELRDAFEAGLRRIPGVRVWGGGAPRLPNTSSVAFAGVSAPELARRLDERGFAVSTGAACHDGGAPSGALGALGAAPELAAATLRVSFGAANEAAQIPTLVAALEATVAQLRQAAVRVSVSAGG